MKRAGEGIVSSGSRRGMILASALAVLVLLSWTGIGHSQVDQWPMFRHEAQHTGKSFYNGPSDPTLAWTYQAGDDIASSPAIGSDGMVYFGSGDANLYGITSNGIIVWSYQAGEPMFSSPAIGSDTVYVGSDDKNLYKITSKGNLAWSYITYGRKE